ncbi:MAG: 4Fe-4S binding protein [Candidatus Bathyarchaeia archaeon]
MGIQVFKALKKKTLRLSIGSLEMVDLTVKLAGFTLRNPIVVSSCTATRDAVHMKKAVDGGASAVVAKSLFGESGSLGRTFPRPRFKLFGYKEYPEYYMKYKSQTRNFSLWSLEEASEFGYREYVEDINKAKRLIGDDGLVIASIAGSSIEEWEDLFKLINGSKADMCELNLSCPYAADMGIQMGSGAVDLAPTITENARKNLSMPFSVKLSVFNNKDPVVSAREVEKAGADAITFPARTSGLMIDIESGKPTAWGAIGGYGGPYLIGHGLGWVSRVAAKISIPILATCGIWVWDDIISYIMVGATAVESGTAIMIRGYHIIKTWLRQIESFMKRKGYDSILGIQGIAMKTLRSPDIIERAPIDVYAEIDREKCTRCGACLRSCFYDAIILENTGAIVDPSKCDGCGMCVEVCPYDAAKLTLTS